jgi:glycosyltransferase involved in cell wall biosynthesis
MKKILFIASHRPDRAPGQRFRFEQYFSFLEKNGFKCELSYFITEKEDKILYQRGKYFQKALIAWKAFRIRFANVLRKNDYDIIFIFREAFLTGSVFFEKQFDKSRAKLVFDFDDAIWHLDISAGNKMFSFLKNPQKTGNIISFCDLVFAGNQYLADYASKYNGNVVIIPTTIDTNEYSPLSKKNTDTITIGWSGSITTIKHFEFALPILRKLKMKYGSKLLVKVIGDASYRNEELGITGIGWKRDDEVKELSAFDIGIMPLPDDEWANGKCGLKGLQYMALEIPTIMSPVGVNTEIIHDGVNGFLASETDEWVEKITRLIENADLRSSIGKAARRTVIDHYSVESQKNRYLEYFTQLISNK